jgi:dsDNA-specific endonuclease/ATPase MutS2
MEDLELAYATKYHEYEQIIESGDPESVPKIQKLNLELSDILSKMLTQLANVKTDAGHIEQYRRDLNDKLVKIQNDYNAIAIKKDTLHTLKGVREHQAASFSGAFFWYSIGLFIAICLFIVLLVYKGSQKVAASAVTASSPSTTPAFMR